MIRKFYFSTFFAALIVTQLVLMAGCDKKASEVSKEQLKGGNVVEVPKSAVKVKLETSMGDIVIELDEKAAPVTTANFLVYVNEGLYDSTIFHRVIKDFMIQGGGFTADMQKKQTHDPIINEASNGLKNDRGTIAMARTNNPNSATGQFFVNHKSNDSLNYTGPGNPGYTVFGKVVEGMDVVDKIAAVKTTVSAGMRDVPSEPVVIKSAKVVSD